MKKSLLIPLIGLLFCSSVLAGFFDLQAKDIDQNMVKMSKF
jgi:hypothetical protein